MDIIIKLKVWGPDPTKQAYCMCTIYVVAALSIPTATNALRLTLALHTNCYGYGMYRVQQLNSSMTAAVYSQTSSQLLCMSASLTQLLTLWHVYYTT